MPIININSDAVVAHTARLERLRRSAIPNAVRNTLNRAAFDVKTDTMLKESDVFIHRRPTFFKANSRVETAKGGNVDSMAATVGFIPKAGDTSHSVEDLQEQETGGNIKGRAFIALPAARTGNSWSKNVRAKNRLANIKTRIADPKKNMPRLGAKQAFIFTAAAAGVGAFIMNTGHTRLLEIKAITREKGDTKVKAVIVDSIKKGRQAHIKPTHFMAKASDKSAHKMNGYFIAEAEIQIERAR